MKNLVMYVLVGLCAVLTACGGPSEEKISQAQLKFNELVEAHNKTIEAHKEVTDDYLDDDLKELTDTVASMKEYNLVELTEEEIDVMIEEMNSAIARYETNITSLAEKKQTENNALYMDIPLTLNNQTGMEIKELYLFRKTEEQGINLLDDTVTLGIGETLTGLYMDKNADAVPWKMILADDSGKTQEVDVQVDGLDERGITLYVQYDTQQDTFTVHDSME